MNMENITSSEEDLQIAIWKLKRMLETLESYSGSGTSVISLIIPPQEQISAITTLLANEYGTASNIKSRVNKNAVLAAITSAQSRLKLYTKMPPNGLAIYCGEIEDEGKTRKIVIDFSPYRPISNFIYLCDSRFHTEHLRELLSNNDVFGFIVMDGKETLMATLSGSTRTILNRFSVDLPKKHGRGGQSAVRFSRLREESRHNYVRKVAEMANSLFINSGPTGNNKPNVSGLILAGSADFKNVLAESQIFDQRLQAIILKQVDVNYGGEQGFNQAIELSGDTLKDVKLVQEVKVINEFLENIARDTRKACFGISDTIRCLEMSCVERLIVWEDLPIYRVVLKTTSKSGDMTIVKYLTKTQLENPDSFIEKVDDEERHLDLMERELLSEWFVLHYKEYGASLEFVTDRSTEGSQFCNGFGGLGGLLRWQVDFTEFDRHLDDEPDDLLDDLEDFI